MKMEQTECSEMLAYKLQMPVDRPEESIQLSEQGECLKSRKYVLSHIICYQHISIAFAIVIRVGLQGQ
jgi:hypothetical protein